MFLNKGLSEIHAGYGYQLPGLLGALLHAALMCKLPSLLQMAFGSIRAGTSPPAAPCCDAYPRNLMWPASRRLACSTSCKGLIHVSSSPTKRYSGNVLPCSSIGSSR